ncbi:MAG: membrane-associated protease RseP (regulator of RpoE activity) [Pirellulaceae bacterium]|jgi:membrane-associated protease RseP (regulator of RpoE activity)
MNDVPSDEDLANETDGIDTYEPSTVIERMPSAAELLPDRARYRRRAMLPLILFIMTCLSTAFVGMTGWQPEICLEAFFYNAMNLRRVMLHNWDNGLLYMVCVLSILFAHEMGHFVAALIYRVPASLPFFIPFPVNFLGTMGAVIGMEGSKADRKQIFDIGLAGPLAGLVIAVPILLYGIQQQDLSAAVKTPNELHLQMPLLAHWMLQWLRPGEYTNNTHFALSAVNPYFIAGWVGLFVTGMNMLPVGQLDGGHITYTLFKKKAHYIAQIFMFFVIALMFYDPGDYLKMILMVSLILFIGVKHPPTRDDTVELGWGRTILGLVSLTIPVLCFPPKIVYL